MKMSRKSSDGVETDVKKIRHVLSRSSLYLVMCYYESREHVMKRITGGAFFQMQFPSFLVKEMKCGEQ